jgi:hypothetical protein
MLYETISYFPSVGALTAKVLWLIVICTQPVDGEKIEYIETGFNLNLGLLNITSWGQNGSKPLRCLKTTQKPYSSDRRIAQTRK